MTKKVLTLEALKRFIKKDSRSLFEIAEYFNATPKEVQKMLLQMKNQHYNILEDTSSMVALGTDMNVGVVTHPFDPRMWQGDVLKFGFSSDNHMCNNNSREDVNGLMVNIVSIKMKYLFADVLIN
jgi:hypothetical protein